MIRFQGGAQMFSRRLLLLGALVAGGFAASPAAAQLNPPVSDPLSRIRAAAAANGQACSVSDASACAQANPKIVAAALGPSPLAGNVRHLDEIGVRATGTEGMDRAAAWAAAAFRDAGADKVEVEKYAAPLAAGGTAEQENVVAEIRGRERPDEFVVLGANLDAASAGGVSDAGCNAALVIEAARDVHVTGLRPRRSIRFVLFSGKEQGMLGSWAYVHAHRADLDRAVAVVIFESGCGRVSGFSLGGRQDLEPGVRESLDTAPIDSWGVSHDTPDALLRADNFDFLLEGVPNLTAHREEASRSDDVAPGAPRKVDLDGLQHSTAVAGVLAFALAEHEAPLGRRLSRAEVAVLLRQTGADTQMKALDAWREWEEGRQGRSEEQTSELK